MHRHQGPPPRKFAAAIAATVLVGTAAVGLLISRYDDRPPWADDIAYEGGFVQASRIRGYDVDGSRVRALLDGECARMERDGMGGARAVHNPARWVQGCLDAAAGLPSKNQGTVR
ncbi:hypothetical protein [Streptomyces sp. NPDC094049]|uniref:hypothetical protein n=1 Tax=Streptomyces sp. NPDC094049 TaxID=3154987 RepID=UPI00331E02A0